MNTTSLAGLLAFSTLLAACSSTPPARPIAKKVVPVSTAKRAVANLASASGSLVSGRLTLVPMGAGVHISGDIGGLQPGSSHGFHIHEKGDCSAVDASSAGGHFNPAAQPHGRAGQGPHHAGDTDNLVADARGVAHVNTHLEGVSLGGGTATDMAGRAIIVHASSDDYSSQPAGNAGARIACGVIKIAQ